MVTRKTATPTKPAVKKPAAKTPVARAILEAPYVSPSLVGLVAEGEPLKASAHKGKWVVLYFYPKDMTPGCTVESRDFQSLAAAFAQEGAVVFGVSKDSCESHAKFSAKEGLGNIVLISDTQGLCEAFGVWAEKRNYGKTYMGIVRSTFLIDPKGHVRAQWSKVKVEGHAEAVLATLKELKA